MMRLNVKRGFFRLWLIGSIVWFAVFAYLGYDEYRIARDVWKPPSWESLEPVDCSKTRGIEGTDFERREGKCWYGVAKLQALYPEYKDLTEDDLSKRLYAAAGTPLKAIPPAYEKALPMLGVGAGVPVGVLVLGWALVWAFSGFRTNAG
jgi:hypothetical protein